jgi:predicted glycoside hydrolase/deacetylase ChbG (UPF0249 family)
MIAAPAIRSSAATEPKSGERVATETPSLRRIWICADDYGIALGVNAAIRDLILRGRINATSVMVTAPSFTRSEARSLAMLNAASQRVAIGLHVTLTAPFRPLTREFMPLREDAFPPLQVLLRSSILRRLDRERIAAEIAAQIDAFAAMFGRLPDFVDGHQHVHIFPQLRDAMLRVVKDKAAQAWVRQCGRKGFGFCDRKALLLDHFSRAFRRRARTHGIATNPAFAGTYDFMDDADFAQLFPRFLARLPEGSVVMCHPGFVDDELTRLDPLTNAREREHAFFAHDDFPKLLAAHGLRLG